MTVTGQGVVNNSTATQTFNVDGGTLNFLNSSTIGPNVDIFNQFGGTTIFGNSYAPDVDNASADKPTLQTALAATQPFLEHVRRIVVNRELA